MWNFIWHTCAETWHSRQQTISVYLSIYLSICLSMVLQSCAGPWPIFSFIMDTQSVGLLARGSARHKSTTYTAQHKHNKRIETSMPKVGFEPTIPAFERAKTVRAATVIGRQETLPCGNSVVSTEK
jgi:hypothetical protein